MAIGICGHDGAKSDAQNCEQCKTSHDPKPWEGKLTEREQAVYKHAYSIGDRNGYRRAMREVTEGA